MLREHHLERFVFERKRARRCDRVAAQHCTIGVQAHRLEMPDIERQRERDRVRLQHERAPDGLAMSALSRALLVSNGNVTVLVQALQRDGLVELAPSGKDRRVSIVRLTTAGAAHFAALAAAHHHWIEAIFAGVEPRQRDALLDLLGALKLSIAQEERAP